jgi:hypothetical protein
MDTAEIFSGNAKLQSINQLDIKIDVISSLPSIFYASDVLVYFILIISVSVDEFLPIKAHLNKRGRLIHHYNKYDA